MLCTGRLYARLYGTVLWASTEASLTLSTIREHWVPLPVAGAPEIMTRIGSLSFAPLLYKL